MAATVLKVYITFYAAYDNDPAGSRDIAYPGPAPRHRQAGGTGSYADPLTLAGVKAWLPVGTIVYVPSLRKYYVMEDQCASAGRAWTQRRFHWVDLYMSSSVNSRVVTAEEEATWDEAENRLIILNPSPDYPTDLTPLYTDSGGSVVAAHTYADVLPG